MQKMKMALILPFIMQLNISSFSYAEEGQEIDQAEDSKSIKDSQGEPNNQNGKNNIEPPLIVSDTPLPKASVDERLAAELGFGWIRMRAAEGDWSSNGFSEIKILWRTGYLGRREKNRPLLAYLRYAPSFVYVDHEDKSYEGVVEFWEIGTLVQQQLGNKVRANLDVGAAYTNIQLSHLGGAPEVKKIERDGATVSLTGGLDFLRSKNVTFGPRLRFGFGRLSTTQMLLAAQVYF
ncbi:MAG: hypothetical protein KBD78_00685 [Oligoflexales bacterium]|nr:hypothetical protein [Oligoflexales bacterium]